MGLLVPSRGHPGVQAPKWPRSRAASQTCVCPTGRGHRHTAPDAGLGARLPSPGSARPPFFPTEQAAALAASALVGSGWQPGQCGPNSAWSFVSLGWMTPGLASRGSESSWVPVLLSCGYVMAPHPESQELPSNGVSRSPT